MSIIHQFEYAETKKFTALVEDYLNAKEAIGRFLPAFPYSEEQLANKGEQRASSFSAEMRIDLIEVLKEQYAKAGIDHSNALARLEDTESVTVCAGHQLCLLGGPLYFVFKIAGAIKLAVELENKTGRKVIPIFWMASEDHDFAEIAKVNLFGSDIRWESNQGGAVGRMKLDECFETFRSEIVTKLGNSENGRWLAEILNDSYRSGESLALATLRFVHNLFGMDTGLIVLDADDKRLKKHFLPVVQKEIQDTVVKDSSKKLVDELESAYHKQVEPRDCNLFLLSEGKRERIDRLNASEFILNESRKKLSASELLERFKQEPQEASPNVMLRPLYQETILPNIAYIGGGAELAYWMELSDVFKACNVHFPAVLLRNSAQLLPKSLLTKWEALGLSWTSFFEPLHLLEEKILELHSEKTFSLIEEKSALEKLFLDIADKAAEIDGSMKSKVLADGARSQKQIDAIEGRMKSTLKKKEEVKLNQIAKLKMKAFPNNSLQERHDNIFESLLQKPALIKELIAAFGPLHPKFLLIGLD